MRSSLLQTPERKPSTAFSRTRHSFAQSSSSPATQVHSHSVYLRNTALPRKRRSDVQMHFMTELSRKRAATATVTIEDRFKDIIENCESTNMDRWKSQQQSKVSLEKSEEQQVLDQSLSELEQERRNHKRFMEIITRKFIDLYPQKRAKLRDLRKSEKFYTENAYNPNSKELPRYLEYNSSFYSRSRRRCYQQISSWDTLKQRRHKTQEQQKEVFSYLQYVADLKAKKRFQRNARMKSTYDCNWLMKSKEKILSFWKNGTNAREQIKILIDQILEEKRL